MLSDGQPTNFSFISFHYPQLKIVTYLLTGFQVSFFLSLSQAAKNQETTYFTRLELLVPIIRKIALQEEKRKLPYLMIFKLSLLPGAASSKTQAVALVLVLHKDKEGNV